MQLKKSIENKAKWTLYKPVNKWIDFVYFNIEHLSVQSTSI